MKKNYSKDLMKIWISFGIGGAIYKLSNEFFMPIWISIAFIGIVLIILIDRKEKKK